ncbi:MAG: RIP metalloprotease RseP [Alphaproteobacteria bacterium]|nr:RIP metalloprotease RseP [Alphaproteobacteria bacterium]
MAILTNIVYYIVPFVVLLGILVFVHEFGHFLAARLLGVKVVAFSIGFGKKIWSRTDKKGTCWQLAAIPLGGYCQFLGDADASSSTVDGTLENLTEEEKKGAFPLQKTWKKILIVVAGPLFNYLFAVLLFCGIFWMYGKMIYPAVVGEVSENSAAQKAGIMAGDKIISVDGVEVVDFMALSNAIQMLTENTAEVVIERPMSVKLQPEIVEACGENAPTKLLGVSGQIVESNDAAAEKIVLPIINKVLPNSPAQKAGLQKGDTLDAVDGKKLDLFKELKEYVTAHQDDEIELQYHRRMVLAVHWDDADLNEDKSTQQHRLLGVKSKPELTAAETYTFPQAVAAGVKETYDITAMTLQGVWQMITGRRGGEDVGGIIRIAELSGDVSKTGGLLGFVYFMALISVNLGLINLFPIPVLDGGNLVIFLIELLIGRELKPNVKDYIFKFGLLVVLALMVFATWNDIVHLIGRIFN